jgi:hypothetical protein
MGYANFAARSAKEKPRRSGADAEEKHEGCAVTRSSDLPRCTFLEACRVAVTFFALFLP